MYEDDCCFNHNPHARARTHTHAVFVFSSFSVRFFNVTMDTDVIF